MLHYHFLPGLCLWYIQTSDRPWLWLFFCIIHALSWLTIYACLLIMDFTEFVGVKQVYYYLVKDGLHPMDEKARPVQSVYRHLRHPGVMCFLVILWVHPVMSLSRLFLALAFSFYLLFGHRVKPDDYTYLRRQFEKKAHSLQEQFSGLN
jgi:hypothetical protein